ncbi:MAG: hypothetical protein ACT4NU_06105 [Chromatiales bacterium]
MSAFHRVPAMLNYTAGTQSMQNACVAAGVRTIITSHRFLEGAKPGAAVHAIEGVQLVQVTMRCWETSHRYAP